MCGSNGRNWNAGENVELVLKSLNGEWLPFTMVSYPLLGEEILTSGSKVHPVKGGATDIHSVMLHELSHIRYYIPHPQVILTLADQ